MKEDRPRRPYMPFIWWAIAITIIWLLFAMFMKHNYETHGGFTMDMFGAANSLFSGLAFAGIIYTIVVQREELRLQREELQLQRREVARSTEELAGQKEMMLLQRFETTFFNLISAHNEIVVTVKAGNMSGRELFDNYSISLNKQIDSEDFNQTLKSYFTNMSNIEICYENLLFILHYIQNEQALDEELKRKYFNIFLAQLSKGQVEMMYFYLEHKKINTKKDIQVELQIMKYFKIGGIAVRV